MANGGIAQVTKTVAALNDATNAMAISGGFNVSIAGTFVATIELQRSFDGESGTYKTVKSYSAPAEEAGEEPTKGQPMYYRLKCTAFTSGSPLLILGM